MDNKEKMKNITINNWVLLYTTLFILTFLSACSPASSQDESPLRNPFTEEQRVKVDLRLFNEIAVRNSGWEGRSQEMRYNLIKQMADDGYEIAELTIRLLNIRGIDWNMPFDREAWGHLKVLADQGDAAAQCLYVWAGAKWDKLSSRKRAVYRERSASQHFPGCARHYATKAHREKRYADAISLEIVAAKLGNHTSQLQLTSGYASGRGAYPLDLGKALCWYAIAQRPEYDTGRSITYRVDMKDQTQMAKKKGITSFTPYDPDSWCEQPSGPEQPLN
ncbi:MAG: hypothetical protein ABW131_07415 [Candidatus Sedimenticola sp. 6PFRAG5]